MDRRSFLQSCSGISLALFSNSSGSTQYEGINNHGSTFSHAYFGLGTAKLHEMNEQKAENLIHNALDLGINHFDTAAAYGRGIAETILGRCLHRQRDQLSITTKTLQRQAKTAEKDLQESLQRLKTDSIEVWMIHDLRNRYEWQELTAPSGALTAMIKAKQEGKVRAIGLSAHRDASIVNQALKEYDFDVILIPVHPHSLFITKEILSMADTKGTHVIGMKPFGMMNPSAPPQHRLDDAYRFALNQEIHGFVTGCYSIEELQRQWNTFKNCRIRKISSPPKQPNQQAAPTL